ncbi:MAG: insulinase family protein [Acidobacteriaceae bacterium]|nr:insulinase family protein [Acidobacteriaceae bacterium]
MRKTILLIPAAAMLAIMAARGAAAEKQPSLPKELPPYGPLKPLTAKDIRVTKLDNGLQVWLVPEQGFPKAAFALSVRGGLAADPKDRPGMADLLAEAVTEGTKTRTAKQLASEIQAAGGDLGANATSDSILLDVSVLAESATKAIALLADVAQNAMFPDKEVEIAKKNLSSSLEAEEAQPSFLAKRALYRALFPGHPYGVVSPTKESLAGTAAADLRREYTRRFRPDQALVVAVGDFDESQALLAIRSAFASWRAPSQPAVESASQPGNSHTAEVLYVPRPNSVQTTLYLGALAPSPVAPDYYAVQVANAIYGGMFGSRLIDNIREDKGYTYSPGANVSSYRETGVLVTRADVRNVVTGASFNEIGYELNRMASTAPTDAELEHAKRYMVGTLALSLQSRGAVARSLARLWTNSLPAEELWKQGEKLEHVSIPDVESAGHKYFPASRMTVVAVGDEKVIKESLSPFGLEFKKAQ